MKVESSKQTTAFSTGAVRSADADLYDFASLPMIGILGLMRNGGVGGQKYGRHNYHFGMPVHECINHAVRHLVLFLAGDRTEPHLIRAAWNCLVAEQEMVLHPAENEADLLGPGSTMTRAMVDRLDANKATRAMKRAGGDFDAIEQWTTAELPEVKEILAQRRDLLYAAASDAVAPVLTDGEGNGRTCEADYVDLVPLEAEPTEAPAADPIPHKCPDNVCGTPGTCDACPCAECKAAVSALESGE